jgi:hypothetical protein
MKAKLSKFDEELNIELKNKLKDYFFDKGIVSWIGCCRYGCSASYNEYNDNFKETENGGIYYISLYLSGMNYQVNPTQIYIAFNDYDYLMKNLQEQTQLIKKFCEIIGLDDEDYVITFPKNKNDLITIQIYKDLNLEDYYDYEDCESYID